MLKRAVNYRFFVILLQILLLTAAFKDDEVRSGICKVPALTEIAVLSWKGAERIESNSRPHTEPPQRRPKHAGGVSRSPHTPTEGSLLFWLQWQRVSVTGNQLHDSRISVTTAEQMVLWTNKHSLTQHSFKYSLHKSSTSVTVHFFHATIPSMNCKVPREQQDSATKPGPSPELPVWLPDWKGNVK